jgi:hypothetical protein
MFEVKISTIVLIVLAGIAGILYAKIKKTYPKGGGVS